MAKPHSRVLPLLYTVAERVNDYIHLAASSTCIVLRRSESQLADALWESEQEVGATSR